MKTFLLFFIGLVGMVNTISAQDNIILKNGTEITGKVIRIGVSVLEYKVSDNLEGPIIELPRNQVFMIQFENGTSQVINSNERAYYPGATMEEGGRPYKSRGGAIALSILFPGAGQYFLKSRNAGLVMTGAHVVGYITFLAGVAESATDDFSGVEEERENELNQTARAGAFIIGFNYIHNVVDAIIRSKKYKNGQNMWGMNKDIRLSPDMVMNSDGSLVTGVKLAWSF